MGLLPDTVFRSTVISNTWGISGDHADSCDKKQRLMMDLENPII